LHGLFLSLRRIQRHRGIARVDPLPFCSGHVRWRDNVKKEMPESILHSPPLAGNTVLDGVALTAGCGGINVASNSSSATSSISRLARSTARSATISVLSLMPNCARLDRPSRWKRRHPRASKDLNLPESLVRGLRPKSELAPAQQRDTAGCASGKLLFCQAPMRRLTLSVRDAA
jgi:hypothetical protein